MMPLTRILDRHFPGIGRIHRATGTTSPKLFNRISDMLTELYRGEQPRHDILRALRDKELSFLQVYEAYRKHALSRLPLGLAAQSLATVFEAWIEALVVGDDPEQPRDYSPHHVATMRTTLKYFKDARPQALVNELADVLEELRESLGAKHPRSYNLARSHAMAFLRAKFKRNHWLWLAAAAVEPRKVPKKAAKHRHTPDEMRTLFPHPETDRLDRIVWDMLTTGMHTKELWGAWSVELHGIRVFGTKRAGRWRRVPLVRVPSTPAWKHRRNFENALRERTDAVTPYDFRRTYSHWLEQAKIPRTRRRMYMGHGAKDITDLYEEHEVTTFLEEDAAALRAFVKLEPPATTLRVEQGGVS